MVEYVSDCSWWFTEKKSGLESEAIAQRSNPVEKLKVPVPDKEQFISVFNELDGNVSAIAKHFARDRRQIYRWMDKYGLER